MEKRPDHLPPEGTLPPPSDHGIPECLVPVLVQNGTDPGSVIKVITTDLSCDMVRCDCFIAVTKDEVIVMTGSVMLDGDEKRRPGKTRIKEIYTADSICRYDRKQIAGPAFEDRTRHAVIKADYRNERIILASSTNSMKDDLRELAVILGGEEERPPEARPERSPEGGPHGGRGGPGGPHGGPDMPKDSGGKGKEDPLRCPKCGRRYADPHRKICIHCMDKKGLVRKLWYFLKRYRFSVFLSVLVLVVSSALSILAPYISSGFYYDEVLNTAGKYYGQLILVLLLVIGTKFLSVLVSIFSRVVTARVSANLQFDLKNTIFRSIERLSLGYFTDKQTGALMMQVSRDASTIYWFFTGGIPYFIINIIQIISIMVIMLIMNTWLSVAYFVTIPVTVLFIRKFSTRMHRFHEKRFTTSKRLNSILTDTFSGIRLIKVFSKEEDNSGRFEGANRSAIDADKTSRRYSTINFPVVDILMILAQTAVMGLGGYFVMTGSMTYGILLTFISYMGMIYSPMFQFVDMTYQATDSMNAMNRLVQVMDAEPDVMEKEYPVSVEKLRGDIEFSHVSFGYDKSRLILDDINFKVDSGTILGIVGHTGAGKTTLANLILRLYDTDSGTITLDGIPIKDMSFDSVMKNISVVSQETYLFKGTILDNIRYANPDATLKEIVEAAKISGAHEFIVTLPQGYHTVIGIGNRELSGGEKQRLSIARALLRNASILILDEATASMDAQTEKKIQNALETLIKGKTTIMIAHRLSTLRMADKLIVLNSGRICEEGTHRELISSKGEYFKLYSLQMQAMKNIGVEE